MTLSKAFIFTFLIGYFAANVLCKIVLPHKLRYLENMLNAEVVVKAAKIRQRMEANPNLQENEKSWPMLLAKYQADDKQFKNNIPLNSLGSIYSRRLQNVK